MAGGLAASFIRYQNNRELYASTDASLDLFVLLHQGKRTLLIYSQRLLIGFYVNFALF
jgi:hypothetical protein